MWYSVLGKLQTLDVLLRMLKPDKHRSVKIAITQEKNHWFPFLLPFSEHFNI